MKMFSVFHRFQIKGSNKSRSSVTFGSGWNIVITYIILILFAVIIVFPLFFVISLSFQSAKEAFRFPPTILPHSLRFSNYITLFEKIELFYRYILNSFIFAGTLTISQLFLSALAGYVLAKFNFPFKRFVTIFVLGAMLFPVNLRAIPLYTLIVKLGLLDSYAGLILPFLAGPFTVFIMRSYILSIPTELIAAARADGASEFVIFLKIILPLSKPALTVVAIFQFSLRWNMLLWPLIATRGNLKTLPVVVAGLKSAEQFTKWNLIGAASVLLLLPTFTLFLLLQRYIVKGTAGALKF